jgi:hypothetical protein
MNRKDIENVNQSDKPVIRDSKGRWLQGSGSPSPGRPPSSRQKIAERLLQDLSKVWNEHGASVLQHLAVNDPGKLATIAYGLLPKDIFIKVENTDPLSQLDDEALGDLQSLLATIRSAKAQGNVGEIFGKIEQFLRSDRAAVIEAKVIEAEANPIETE